MNCTKYLLMIMLAIGLVSCGKDGAVGPIGPQGGKGDAGSQGAAGTAGEDGRTILNGTTNPAASLGQVGDFYINTNSYLIFGPKTSSGWGSGKSILGATGATGARGATGATGARGATGAKGDKGDKGDTGARGATGAKGDKGDTGARGATGATGARGATGAKGDKGDKGDKGEADYVILSGANDPTNAIGEFGDFYFNTVTKTLFYRYVAILGQPAWGKITKLSSTIQFTKTDFDIPSAGAIPAIDFDFPIEVLRKSMVNVYIRASHASGWYPLPGYVGDNNNEFRIYFNAISSEPDKSRLVLNRVSGSQSMIDSEISIVIMEADEFRVISQNVDFNDYTAVSRYFQLGN